MDTRRAVLLAPALVSALLVLCAHAAALAFGSLRAGLWAALPAAALLSGLGARGLSIRGAFPRPMLLAATAATALILPAVLFWRFHDMSLVTGHMSIVSAVLDGPYPPRHLSFPEHELKYHYGFNLLSAILSAVLGLRVDRAIAALTAFCWFYSACLLWELGWRLSSPNRPWLAPALALFGGGMPYLARAEGEHSLVLRLLGSGEAGGAPMLPPNASSFFQHPWTLGLPLALAAILLWTERSERPRWPMLALLLLALSLSQIVLFLGLGAALLASELWSRRARPASSFPPLALAAAALGGAALLRGFFAPGPSLAVEAQAGMGLRWHLAGFGALLPLGLLGLPLMTRGRALFGLLVAGGLAAVNFLRYPWSWDMIKWAMLASFFLSLPASACLERLLESRQRRPFGWALLALAVCPGLAFAAILALDLEPARRQLERVPVVALSEDDTKAALWLRGQGAMSELMYRRSPIAWGYAQWHGLPQLWLDYGTYSFPFPRQTLEARAALLRELPGDPDRWRAQGARWFVLDPANPRMSEHLRRWTFAGRARERARFGALTIYELR